MNRARLILTVVAFTLALVPATAHASPSAAPTPSTPAEYSRAAMTRSERATVNQALGKVTKAGKVAGVIDAQVGDYVLGCTVSDGFSGDDPCPTVNDSAIATNTTLTAEAATTTAATTVLHASSLGTLDASPGPGSSLADIRTQLALEENTTKQVRFYHRQRLAYGPAGDISTTWTTYHDGTAFEIHKGDYGVAEADNCLGFYTSHCTARRDAGDACRGGSGGPCDVWLEVGSYRNKGDGENRWIMQTQSPKYWHPILNQWKSAGVNCSSSYRVGLMWEVDGSPAPFNAPTCPIPTGRTFA